MAVEEFDYVIVGGGSAGCVLASRLSEDRNRSVLLLEACGRDCYLSSPNDIRVLRKDFRVVRGVVRQKAVDAFRAGKPRQARNASPMRTSTITFARPRRRCSMRRVRAGWGATNSQWSTRYCGCTGSSGCDSSMPP